MSVNLIADIISLFLSEIPGEKLLIPRFAYIFERRIFTQKYGHVGLRLDQYIQLIVSVLVGTTIHVLNLTKLLPGRWVGRADLCDLVRMTRS